MYDVQGMGLFKVKFFNLSEHSMHDVQGMGLFKVKFFNLSEHSMHDVQFHKNLGFSYQIWDFCIKSGIF
jgi:hypothetical protein